MAETSFAVPLANMKISAVDGAAFLDCGSSGSALLRFLGDKVTVADSAGKTITGFIKAAGTGETLGGELIGAGDCANSSTLPYDTFDGVSATGFHAVKSTAGSKYAGTADEIAVVAGWLLKRAASLNLASGTVPQWSLRSHIGGVLWGAPQAPMASGANAAYETLTAGGTGVLRFVSGSNGDFTVSGISVKQVLTPSATGVTIVSASGGTTFNWTSKDAAFNYADASGYTVTITNSSIEVYAYRTLTADAATARRVNTRIYPVVMPQKVALPAVSYQRVSADPVNTLSGYAGMMNAHIVINSWAQTYDEAKALALEIRTAMNGAAAFKSLLVNELDGYDPDVSLYVVSQDYSCWGEE